MADIIDSLRRDVFGDAPPRQDSERGYALRRFCSHYAPMSPGEISWEEVCEFSKGHHFYPRFAIALVAILLERDLYQQDHGRALRLYRDMLRRAVRDQRTVGGILCGDAVELLADQGTAEFLSLLFNGNPFRNVTSRSDLDPKMVEVLKEVFERLYQTPPACLDPYRRFFRHYAGRSACQISWGDVCADADAGKWGKRCSIMLIVVLLDRGLYSGERRDRLMSMRDCLFSEASDRFSAAGATLLCGSGIDDLRPLPRNKRRDGYLGFVSLKGCSPFLERTMIEFLQSEGVHSYGQDHGKVDVLVRSFGEIAGEIAGLDDFTDSLFWQQADAIRRKILPERKALSEAARFLRGFYLYLVDSNPEHDFFSRSSRMSDELLRSPALTEYVSDGTYVTSYAPGLDLGSRPRVALIMRGYDNLSTRMRVEDHVLLNVSNLDCPLYRRELLAFLCSTPSRAITGENSSALVRLLQMLYEAKSRKGHPNPDLGHVTRAEAFLIREAAERLGYAESTLKNELSTLSVFLQWEKCARGAISVEEYALDHFTAFSQAQKPDAEPIPDDELAMIAAHMAAKASEGDLADKVFFSMLCVALETEMRPSQICHLTIDSIKPSVKPGEFVIHSATKTSGGEKVPCLITELTRRRLLDVIDATEPLRSECATGELGRYIFLIRSAANGSPIGVRTNRFSDEIKECCADLGLKKRYTASNLRDTHMTKAVEYAIRKGRPDLEVAVLSGHKRISTTLGHYVELELEKMLESTYGVVITGTIDFDARGRVVEKIPVEADAPELVVEGGCGNCTARECAVTAPLSCLLCQHFVTTVAHEPFFIRAIEAVEAQILAAGTRHDADDLVTIKTVLVMYLQAIYERKASCE